ncbi:unnamed protein product, partial [Amoebophrya sp. A25]|eukprot:GSA25T00015466001.1
MDSEKHRQGCYGSTAKAKVAQKTQHLEDRDHIEVAKSTSTSRTMKEDVNHGHSEAERQTVEDTTTTKTTKTTSIISTTALPSSTSTTTTSIISDLSKEQKLELLRNLIPVIDAQRAEAYANFFRRIEELTNQPKPDYFSLERKPRFILEHMQLAKTTKLRVRDYRDDRNCRHAKN